MRTVGTVFINIPDLERIPEKDRWRILYESLREITRAQAEQIRRLEADVNRLKKETENRDGKETV